MFDLFRSRAKAVRYVLGGMLMLVALSMVITLIPGWGTQSRADDNVVAEVGKTAITVRDVQNELQGLVRNRQLPSEMDRDRGAHSPESIRPRENGRSRANDARNHVTGRFR